MKNPRRAANTTGKQEPKPQNQSCTRILARCMAKRKEEIIMAGKTPSPGVMENALAFLRFHDIERMGFVQAVLRIESTDGEAVLIEGKLDHGMWRQRVLNEDEARRVGA